MNPVPHWQITLIVFSDDANVAGVCAQPKIRNDEGKGGFLDLFFFILPDDDERGETLPHTLHLAIRKASQKSLTAAAVTLEITQPGRRPYIANGYTQT